MEANDRERCVVLLAQLAEKAIAKVFAMKVAGRILPSQNTVHKYTATNIDYSPDGGMDGITGENSIEVREEWHLSAMTIADDLRIEPEADELKAKGLHEGALFAHIARLGSAALNGETLTADDMGMRRASLLDGLTNPTTLLGEHKLHVVGLVIQDEPFAIQFDKWKISFRRPVPADFCYVSAVGAPHDRDFFIDAFAKIDGIEDSDDLLVVARWASAIIKLAIPSGVATTGADYRLSGMHGTSVRMKSTIQKGHKNPPAKVGAANVARFKALCEYLSKHFGQELVDEDQTRVDHFAIAYHRYAEALSATGLIERRIAVAVMGIESLFMTDKDVIGYKLSMRLPKLLSLVGENPVATKKLISDAYGIRSKYVHGDSLTPKEMKKVVEPHGGMDAMLAKLITCLRLALILCLCGLPEKQKRVSLIDNALIDPSKQDELSAAVAPVKPFLTV
jgi:hypothetical protein